MTDLGVNLFFAGCTEKCPESFLCLGTCRRRVRGPRTLCQGRRQTQNWLRSLWFKRTLDNVPMLYKRVAEDSSTQLNTA